MSMLTKLFRCVRTLLKKSLCFLYSLFATSGRTFGN